MLEKAVKDHYDIEIKSLERIADHRETKVYLLTSEEKKYVLKTTLSAYKSQSEDEGELTQYLYDNGIHVARLLQSNNGRYVIHHDEWQFHIQEFIEGKILRLNSAPAWYLKKSARLLGQMQSVLSRYKELPHGFDEGFVCKTNLDNEKQSRLNQLNLVKEKMSDQQYVYFQKRFRHFDRVFAFEFDMERLTRSNSHGDFYIGQVICGNEDNDLTVIDWESACYLPLCLEVIMSYTYADPACRDGRIDYDHFKIYLHEYMKYISLSHYDLVVMPYFYYYYLCLTSFWPPYEGLSDDYLRIAGLMDSLMDWLYDHVDDLSRALCP